MRFKLSVLFTVAFAHNMFSFMWIRWTPIIGSLLAFLLAVYYWVWSRSRFVRLINAIPGPKALPLLGNVLDLNVNHDGSISLFDCYYHLPQALSIFHFRRIPKGSKFQMDKGTRKHLSSVVHPTSNDRNCCTRIIGGI